MVFLLWNGAKSVIMQSEKSSVIAFLTSGQDSYGVRRAILNATKAFSDIGVNSVFYFTEPGPFEMEARQLQLNISLLDNSGIAPFTGETYLQKLRSFTHARTDFKRIRAAFVDRLRSDRVDAVYVRWPNLVQFAGKTARLANCKVLWHMPNIVGSTLPFGLNRVYYQMLCLKYGIIPLANSHYTASTLGSFPVSPRVLYVGADAARFNPDSVQPKARANFQIHDDAIIFGIVGRIDPSKGQDRFLRAMLEIRHQYSNRLHLVLVGGPTDSKFANDLREIARCSDATDRLHLIGSSESIPEFMGMIDVVVNSRIDPEPYGNTIVEAMFMNKPVAAHCLGGPSEIIVDGVTGWLVENPEISTWQSAIVRILNEKESWSDFGSMGRQRAHDKFTSQRMAQSIASIAGLD